MKRIRDMEAGLDEKMVDGEDEWIEAKNNHPTQTNDEIQDIDAMDVSSKREEEVIPDIDDDAEAEVSYYPISIININSLKSMVL